VLDSVPEEVGIGRVASLELAISALLLVMTSVVVGVGGTNGGGVEKLAVELRLILKVGSRIWVGAEGITSDAVLMVVMARDVPPEVAGRAMKDTDTEVMDVAEDSGGVLLDSTDEEVFVREVEVIEGMMVDTESDTAEEV
jgi:hypothetical protein